MSRSEIWRRLDGRCAGLTSALSGFVFSKDLTCMWTYSRRGGSSEDRSSRRYRFSRSHRLHSQHLSEAENQRHTANAIIRIGHGHDYVLSVTVTGPVTTVTGLILSEFAASGRLVEDQCSRGFSYRNFNLDVPSFERAGSHNGESGAW